MRTAHSLPALLVVLLLTPLRSHAQGVMIVDAVQNILLTIDSSHVDIRIEDQVALVRSTQRFINNTTDTVHPKFAYPMPEAASATRLRWLNDDIWNTASMVAQPPDTTLPGAGSGQGGQDAAPQLLVYLGETPLYFRIMQGIPPGVAITVELSYVELLTYANARVELSSASNYAQVTSAAIPWLLVDVSVRSQRAITGIDIQGLGTWQPVATSTFLSADSATVHVVTQNAPASCGFTIGYDLDPSGYGLISMSNYLPDSLVKCDELGNGFFVLLIEPEPSSTVMGKDFVIVIDKSGSMSGSKIQEARNAASYMVNNLNPGDLFNVIAFDSGSQAWSSGLQPFNANTMNAALTWIAQIQASGGTNINSAITLGINNYQGSLPDHARPMIFLTDGQDSQPNSVILSNAMQLRMQIAPDLQIFTFGVGNGFNEQLLNQLAVQNNGVSQFLDMADFSQVMGEFYSQIQDPVLIAPVATFDRPDVQDIHPQPLIGLFVGQQMALVGRYDEPGPVDLHLEGTASGTPVAFDYTIDLTGEFDEDRQFIPKVWAQKAITALLDVYYAQAPNSPMALMLEDSISSYSLCYGVSSPFTSFADPGTGGTQVGWEDEEGTNGDPLVQLAYPDPAPAGSSLTFDLTRFMPGQPLRIIIRDLLGRVVLEQDLTMHAGNLWTWDGLDDQGRAAQGQLIYQLIHGQASVAGRLTRY